MGLTDKSFKGLLAAFSLLLAPLCLHSVQAKPARVVSTNVCADQLVVLLAEPRNIASLSRLSVEPEISNLSAQARAYPKNNARAEEIVQLKPDLVVGDVQTGKHANSLAKSIGVPVHLVGWPSSLKDVETIISDAGHALGEEARATQVIKEMRTRIATVSPKGTGKVTALVYEPNGLTLGAGTLTGDILQAAGLTNIARELTGADYGSVALERVIIASPNLIILDDSYTQSSSKAQSLLRHPALRSLNRKAVIYRMPSRLWLCPGPWAAEAVERLAAERTRISRSLASN